MKRLVLLFIFCTLGLSNAFAQLTKEQFLRSGVKLKTYYTPIFTKQGYRFDVELDWDDTEMAFADVDLEFKYARVVVTGDFALEKGSTPDTFMMILCHEMGHILGGAPYVSDWGKSFEGQAEYYATLRCFKEINANEDNESFVKLHQLEITPVMIQLCSKVYQGKELALCLRSILTSYKQLKNHFPKANLSLTKKDPTIVEFNDFYRYGSPQCRLDTLVAGALCNAKGKLSNTDYKQGTCTTGIGARPRCWFDPNNP